MIEFIFRINNPWTKDGREQKDYVMWNKLLSDNWATELQISKWSMDNFFEIWVDTSWRGKDHAGPTLYLEFLGYMFNFKIYNRNHWNWDTGQFYTQEEAEAEWKAEQEEQND